MAVFSREKIIERIKDGTLSFSPALDAFQLKSDSIDLRMGFTFLVPKLWHVTKQGREALHLDYYDPDPHKPNYYEVVELEQGQFFDILPQEHVIVSTLESIKMPGDAMAILFPRSSVNRRGLSVDLSGIIDAGYEGQLVIPITNNTRGQTIRLYPGERFCQIVIEELTNPTKVVESRFHRKDVVKGITSERSALEMRLIRKGEIKKLKAGHPLK
ncbi:MAG: dCTP deaminase [Candidatus Yanofskybacteria bacterium RIFCSPLOWO2_01_FULL_49_25]|uniref:dCTP deaminase n=1 Tax=Candidatus Yanofskybacteria bacterium RIFCSPLOWO2_01_FULL_49_25 TaxID=1802701 RepID=A0A1F8GV68_9BACT|nr:MAG: dCTP deaminase [Candidatus Yanofskybacteria bacterium RIFCSPLOWO2_01_FULL_49_25]